ncbi:N-acetyltransferase [Desulfogranum mediterraneum]|uniref:N-acetyltransferase n=1 Tax=Desulfogranum mediterraneum TaxID=160661 RepID=UPI0004139555|nr:N-acetyltransferase [Desulfogranum mediterraneum]
METTTNNTRGRIRPARMGDVRAIHTLLMTFASRDLMLPKSISALYDNLRDFIVYEEAGEIRGICSLHICWDDLAEIRSLALVEELQGSGIGRQLVESCLDEAVSLEIGKVFVLTYQADFFRKLGFVDKDKQELPHKIWSDCLNCSKFPDCDEDALIRILSKHPYYSAP